MSFNEIIIVRISFRIETLYVVDGEKGNTIYVVFVKIYFDNVYKY